MMLSGRMGYAFSKAVAQEQWNKAWGWTSDSTVAGALRVLAEHDVPEEKIKQFKDSVQANDAVGLLAISRKIVRDHKEGAHEAEHE